MQRKVERRLLFAAAGWNFCTAAATLILFGPWLGLRGYPVLAAAGSLGASDSVPRLQAVIAATGLFALVASLVSAIIAHYMSDRMSGTTMTWLIGMTIASLVTRDIPGLLLYLLTLTFYCARNRALRQQTAFGRTLSEDAS